MSLQFDGYLMSRDLPVAQFSRGKCNPLREELLPFHFANHGTLEEWLQRRAMDCHSRTNARLLRRALRIEDNGAEWLSFRVEGATITDTYWLKQKAALSPIGTSVSRKTLIGNSHEMAPASMISAAR